MSVNIQHCYEPTCASVSKPPGFADFIIGTMSLYTIFKDCLSVNYENHAINSFLINKRAINKYILREYNKDITLLPTELIFNPSTNVIEAFNIGIGHIINLTNNYNTPLRVSTNSRGYTLTSDLICFIKDTFACSQNLQNTINTIIETQELLNFDVIHIRLGDMGMHIDLHEEVYMKALNQISCISNASSKTIFITSDNKGIKTFLKNKMPALKMLDSSPVHLGDLEYASDQNVRDTLIDFFIMAKAKKISCYSVYGGSGFSFVCSELFNIPYSAHFLHF